VHTVTDMPLHDHCCAHVQAGGDKRKDSTHGDSRNSATANGKHSNNRQQKDSSAGGKAAAGANAADKSSGSGSNSPTTSSRASVKAPEITDEAFPSLPGIALYTAVSYVATSSVL
jgi:hypothetical protein